MFSFISLSGKVDISVNEGAEPYVFKLHRQNYYLLGSLLSKEWTAPKFAQLYIYDIGNEISNIMNILRHACNY